MVELLRWLAKLAKHNQTRPELFEALLTGRYRRYAYYRLRFLMPRILLRLLTQFFEVFVLSTVLPWEYFVPLLSYRATSALIGGSYWGALEELRSRVRKEARKRHYESARMAIEAWLGLSVVLACACVVGIVLWTRYSFDPTGDPGFSLFDGYALACFTRLSLDLVARTYHAGIFALSRVYRPLATILLPDVLELVFVILAWNSLGPWGIALSIIVAGAIRSSWTYYYARKAYDCSRIPRPKFSRGWHARRAIGPLNLGESALHAVANGSAQLDSLLILSLAHLPTQVTNAVPLAVVYYIMRPLMSAAHGWTRAFYFDWKRIETGIGQVFQPRMRAMLVRVGLTIALAIGSIVALMGYLLWQEQGLLTAASLLPLFVARTVYSREQLEAFSLGHYKRLARMTIAVVLAVILFGQLHLGERELVLSAAAVLFVAAFWSMHARSSYQTTRAMGLGLGAWLMRLSSLREPVHLFAISTDRQIASADRLVRAAVACFPREHIARAGGAHIFALAPARQSPTRAQLVAAVGGAVRELSTIEGNSGSEAATQLVAQGWLQRAASIDLSLPGSSRVELIKDFRQGFPNGHVVELDVARGQVAAHLPWIARMMVLREIAMRGAGGRPRVHSQAAFHIAVLASQAMPQVVFVAPREAQGFAAFRHRVEHASLRSALQLR